MMIPRSNRPDTGLATAVVAIGSVSSLTTLTVFGVLTRVPAWAAVTIVVVLLLSPLLVYRLLKTAEERDKKP